MAGVQRRGKGERRAREAREDRTREDRGRDRVPSPSRAHFDFAPFLRPATQATYHVLWSRHVHGYQLERSEMFIPFSGLSLSRPVSSVFFSELIRDYSSTITLNPNLKFEENCRSEGIR